MKYFFTVLLVIYLVSSPTFPGKGHEQGGSGIPNSLPGTFFLVEDTPLRVSIDTGWERNGQVPVILTLGGLEIIREINIGNLSRALGTETGISEILVEDVTLSFITYEQNSLRTRMKLLDKNIPVKLKINREKGMVEVYVGDSRLKLDPIHVTLTEIAPGELYELTFMGTNVRHHSKLVFFPSRGIIYAVPHDYSIPDITFDPGKNTGWSVWAARIEPGIENPLTNDRERER